MNNIQTETDRELTVAGYRFLTKDDALLAKAELTRIEQLELRLDYSKPQTVYTVYTKAIENGIFVTPVGHEYLKRLREYLEKYHEGDKADIIPIPLSEVYGGTGLKQEVTNMERVKQQSQSKKETVVKRKRNDKAKYRNLYLIIAVLVIVIVGMFVITLKGTTPNILNYERVLENRYASWNEELKEREQAIRIKERELGLDDSQF